MHFIPKNASGKNVYLIVFNIDTYLLLRTSDNYQICKEKLKVKMG